MARKRILCYGDSNTWGYIPGIAERYDEHTRWTGVLQDLLGTEDYLILEDGINGRTTVYEQEWARGRNGLTGLDYALQAQKPLDLVIVMLGTNDLSMMEMKFVELGIKEICRTVKNADAILSVSAPIFPDGPKVLLIAPPNYNTTCDNPAKYEESKKFPEVCERVADLLGIDYLDGSIYAEVSDIDCHLTANGHRQLGIAVAEKVRKIFA